MLMEDCKRQGCEVEALLARKTGEPVERQTRRCVGPQVDVSPNSERRQAPTLASLPLQRTPDSHGGGIDGEGSASRKKPVEKPMSRHTTSGVPWMARTLQTHQHQATYATAQVSRMFPTNWKQ